MRRAYGNDMNSSEHPGIAGRAEARDRVPAIRGVEAERATAHALAQNHIIEDPRFAYKVGLIKPTVLFPAARRSALICVIMLPNVIIELVEPIEWVA